MSVWDWLRHPREKRAARRYARARGWHLPVEERARRARERAVGAPVIHVDTRAERLFIANLRKTDPSPEVVKVIEEIERDEREAADG